MTGNSLKRLFLIAATLIVIPLLGASLWSSLTEPQITDRLQLYQTDLLLHVNELESDHPDDAGLLAAQRAVLGQDPLKTALEQYQEVRQSATANLKKFAQQTDRQRDDRPSLAAPAETLTPDLPVSPNNLPDRPSLDATASSTPLVLNTDARRQQTLIDQLDLRIGILQAEQGNPTAALNTWDQIQPTDSQLQTDPNLGLATALTKLWSDPPQLLPDAELQFQQHLEGWFRYSSLSRLYQLQQRSDALQRLQQEEQEIARQTLIKLALVSTVPAIGAIIGVVLIISLGIRRLTQSTRSEAGLDWQVPWGWETIAWVLIVGFFFVGQIAIPGVLGLGKQVLSQAGITVSLASLTAGRSKAFYTLAYYLLMSSTGLLILYRSVKPFTPLPEDWFRLTGKRNWLLWGLGGYFVALPLMFAVSLVNQQFWQGQGGSNPLLQIVLEEGDPVALLIFFFTAAVAAPVFEEILFRGFLLPSLTRYVPVWGAIGLSSLLFALAHLSLSEVIPLATLGAVLGFVYTRSRGLLASMLMHSLWNSITMIGLFILGSGTA
ncbi:MAG: CPBP family intramembrane metalloprotease [Elainella sp. Prado103]|jgi:hypothetical protein|nr:CPBP family intramembrane metalloprotease [Elainella sp. Prado103]